MRVFHGPNNIGGAAGVLAAAQRSLGVEATSVCYATGTYAFSTDRTLQSGLQSRLALLAMAREFDVFHFYYGESLSGARLVDIPWLRRAGKQVYFYFCGCDLRDSKYVIANQEISACAECWPMGCSANRELAVSVARESDGVFVSTPDLLDFVPDATLLPQPLVLDRFETLRDEIEPDGGGPVRVAHAPSSRRIKGTHYVEEAVASLQDRGMDVELVLVEGRSYEESLAIYASCHVGVDQMLIGAYGGFAVEMMALGKPAVCYLSPRVLERYPVRPPIVSAEPTMLADVLADLIERRAEWPTIGAAGIDYVHAVHDARAVAQVALDRYALGGRG